MTLVMSCLTHRYVVQVSDRRITRLSNGAIVEDSRNKGTTYCGQMSFAYSGLANIDNHPTDEWLAEKLASASNLYSAIDNVRDQATELFHRIKLPAAQKRIAFVGVGFVRPSWSTELLPGRAVITNALDDDWKWKSTADTEFRRDGMALDSNKSFEICPPIGASISKQLLKKLNRNITLCVNHDTGALEIIRLLAQLIRQVAEYSPDVGKSLLATVIPKNAALKDDHTFSTPITPNGFKDINSPMFFHIPAHSNDLNWNCPNYVCKGMFFTDVKFTQQ